MGWAHQIDVVTAPSLKRKHHLSQFFFTDGATFAQLTYGVVLAVKTGQVAIGKEDGSRAVSADKGTLFSKVGAVARDEGLAGEMALPAFASKTVGTTVTRAEMARLQYPLGFFHPGFKLSSVVELFVSSYFPYSSFSGSFFPFLITSTVVGGGIMVSTDIFLVSFFDFFGSLCR